MRLARITALLGLAAASAAFRAGAYEVNVWPGPVLQMDETGNVQSWSALGPFLFSGQSPGPEAGRTAGFRPLYVVTSGGGCVKTDLLYPLFYYRQYSDGYKWSVFDLINGQGTDTDVARVGVPTDRHFDIWPIYFSHEAADPAQTYHALLPVYGTIKYRLGYDRIFWAPFPLYVETAKKGKVVTYIPFPIVRLVRGTENGFGLWPLYGETSGPGPARHLFIAWPLFWDNTVEPGPDAPAGTAPGTQFGFLPFYTRESDPGSISENYLWPFFGYTEKTAPYRYSERRYFWPFLVQGKGDGRLVERWGPFYTHSDTKGVDSTWVAWPFWHKSTWVDGDIRQAKTQFFYFLYWSMDESIESRPAVAHAYKRHIWPILSIWDNGAGSRQVQFPSPMDVFFSGNLDMPVVWTPLFSIYRYDHRPTGETRTSLLWGAITWRRDAGDDLAEFHLGPLVGMRRRAGGPVWSFLGFDFGPKSDKGKEANR
jgi:hypothetical protein